LEAALATYADYIAGETLAVVLERSEALAGEVLEANVDGAALRFTLVRQNV
jgi:hypothetical protein